MNKPYYITSDAVFSTPKEILSFPYGAFVDVHGSFKCFRLTNDEVVILKLRYSEIGIREYRKFNWVYFRNMDYLYLKDIL